MDNEQIIFDLEELSGKDIPLAGGKGANLGELTRVRMPVPSGFVITTAAYDLFVNQNGLGEVITKALQNENNDGTVIRGAFVEASISPEVEQAIVKAYQKLEGGAVAVRSSATAEDLPGAAFAGQQETYLNIVGEKELLDAVRRTWASLWTERAIAYRTRQRIDQEKVKLAVVVQRMVDAEFAGVMFTANPVTGNRKEVVIDASPGLGEAVVSGLVTPDHFVLRQQWQGWSVIEQKAGRREVVIKPKKEGGTERIEKPDTYPQLPRKVLIELAEVGARVAKHFNRPQDIEWVWADGKILLVQSRPITALPDEFPKQNRISRRLSGIMAEVLPSRPYPFEATTLGPKFLFDDFFRPFLKPLGLRILPVDQLFIEEDGVLICYNGRLPFRPTPAILLASFRILLTAVRYSPAHWKRDPLIKEAVEKIKILEMKSSKGSSPKELIAMAREALEMAPVMVEIRMRYLPRTALAMLGVHIMLLIAGQRHLEGTLLFTGIKTKVTETNHALEGLAAKVRSNKSITEIFQENDAENLLPWLEKLEAGKGFLKEFHDFLDEYGYRESGGTMLISQPTWKESPEIVLGMLKGLINAPARPKANESWEDICDALFMQSILRFQPLRLFFTKLLDTARHIHEIREDTRFYIMMPVPTLRRAVLELGGRLTKANICNEPKDVFYLKLDELEEVARALPLQVDKVDEWKSLISRRKSKYAALENTPFVDPRLYRTMREKGEALLVGTPGSPGVVEGPARVIQNSSEFERLNPGDVLVAPYTNPAWTPLFERAGGVVVDTGGAMSHAAIVAREYGIPAVMGTVEGTEKIRDGDRIRVDGTNGQVFAIDSSKT